MVQFLLDISRWQGSNPDIARAKADGIVGVIAKATQGSGWVDPMFRTNLDRCRRAGLLFAAYHYQEAGVSASAQVANIRRTVPKDVPVIPDVENGSGGVDLTREIVRLLRAEGYTVPLSYIPRWYWQQLGSPSLAGLPPLWSSRYPDNVVNDYRTEFSQVPARFWDGYGGLPVALLQFTSSARVAGYSPLDCNAFRGTLQDLKALLGGAGETAPPKEWDEMASKEEIRDVVRGETGPIWDVLTSPMERTLNGETKAVSPRTTWLWGYVHAYRASTAGQANAAAIAALAKALADSKGVDADELVARVEQAIAEAVIKVDVRVDGAPE